MHDHRLLVTMKLLTKAIRRQLPPIEAIDASERPLDFPAVVKLFTPDSSWTWYAAAFDGEDILWGLVDGIEVELGPFRLSELRSVRGQLGLPVERDRYFTPRPLRELLAELEARRR